MEKDNSEERQIMLDICRAVRTIVAPALSRAALVGSAEDAGKLSRAVLNAISNVMTEVASNLTGHQHDDRFRMVRMMEEALNRFNREAHQIICTGTWDNDEVQIRPRDGQPFDFRHMMQQEPRS